MIRIGITGGIGSGKSIICKILEQLGYPVFHSDDVAKLILNNDHEVQQQITSEFGPSLYENGVLDRKALAHIIFNNEEARTLINSLVHPKVRQAFTDYVNEQGQSLVFNEAAILFETGSYKKFDKNILITAPESIRIQRVMSRDKVSEEDVRARMGAQWSDEEKSELADYIIVNDDKTPVLKQVNSIIEELTNQLP